MPERGAVAGCEDGSGRGPGTGSGVLPPSNAVALDSAFTAARYRIDVGDSTCVLTIGSPCPVPPVPWLTRHVHHGSAWLITAHNPGARALEPAVNAARHTVLWQRLSMRATAILDSLNEDPEGIWPVEPGFLIAGLEESMARTLGRRFGQLAIVGVAPDQPVRLLWL